MSRWDTTLAWGPDDADRDADEATAVMIAAAVRELAEQRALWRPVVHALLAPLFTVTSLPPSLPERR